MTLDEKIDLLRKAIQSRLQVTGFCNQLPREFCPHILGRKGIKWNVLVWQFDGMSDKGLPPEGAWRCFELHDLDQLATREGDWHRGFSSGRDDQHCVDQIDTVIDAAHGAELRETFGMRSRGLSAPRKPQKKWR